MLHESQERLQTHDQQFFKEALQHSIEFLETNGIEYRAIGSLGLHGIIPELVFQPEMTSKVWLSPYHDIDIIVAKRHYENPDKLKKLIGNFNREIYPAFVDDTFSRKKWIEYERGKASLGYYKYKVEIPSTIFAATEAKLLGVKFKTVPPPTLFHISGIIGELRKQDKSALLVLGRWLREHPSVEYPEESYQQFHEFYKGKLGRFPFHAFYLHRRHMKDESNSDTFGQVYSHFPDPLRLLQREVAKACLWTEGHIR